MFLHDPPASDRARATADADLAADGYVARCTRLWAWDPDLHEAYERARDLAVEGSGLPARDVALLVTATATARSDAYCALAFGSRLARRSSPEVAAAVLRGTDDGLDERSRTLAAWARRVATDPNATTADDVARLRALGLSDREVFAATALIALRMAFSTVNDALGAAPDAELAAAVPAPVRAAVTFGRAPAGGP